MSKMKNMVIEIEEAIQAGKMSFRQIADYYGCSYNDVNLIAEQLMTQCIWDCDY